MNTKEIIRERCKDEGISLPKLEKALGFGEGTISKWDKSVPTVDKLVKVAEYFNIPLDELVDRKPIDEEILNKPKELQKILKNEDIALNGRLMSDEDKEKMFRIIEAAFWDAKIMNKRSVKKIDKE